VTTDRAPHRTPEEHYAEAQLFLFAAEDADYGSDREAYCFKAATAHAILATVDPGVAARAYRHMEDTP
jgi:hypothetical protein